MIQKAFSVTSDKTGIASAVLCTIHCMVIPILFLIRYWIPENPAGYRLPLWWEQLDFLFLAVSLWAVYHSARHSASKAIKVFLILFWAILATAIIFQSALHWLAYIASAGLIGTHLVNIRRTIYLNRRLSPVENTINKEE